MPTKLPTSVFYVRSLPLQRELIDEDGKSLQAYKPGSKVELTEAEAIKYQHLVETEESYKQRESTKSVSKAKK